MRNQKFLVFLLLLGGSGQQINASNNVDLDMNLNSLSTHIHETEPDQQDTEYKNFNVSEMHAPTNVPVENQIHEEALQAGDSRLISQTTVSATAGANNIQFGEGIYDPNSTKLWVFASSTGGNQGSVGNFFAHRIVGRNTITFTPTAPETVTLNAAAGQLNPLYNKEILQATLFGSANIPAAVYTNGRKVVTLGNAAGTSVFTNLAPLRDAAAHHPAAVATPAVALAGDYLVTPFIIAAVPQGGPAHIATPDEIVRDGYVSVPLTTATTGLEDLFTAASKPLASTAVSDLALDDTFREKLTDVVSDAVSFAKTPVYDDITTIENVIVEILYDLQNPAGKIPQAVANAGISVTAANIVSAFSDPIAIPVMIAIAGSDLHANLSDISIQLADIVAGIDPDSAFGGAVAAIQAAVGWSVNQIFFAEDFTLASTPPPFSWGTGPHNGTVVDGHNRGFAIVQNNGVSLAQMNPADVTTPLAQSALLHLRAMRDSNPANITVAFYKNNAASPINTAAMASDQGGDNAFICRDEPTNRYYVGLQNVSRGSKVDGAISVVTNLDGGVISALVGGINSDNEFFIQPILANPTKAAFVTTADQAIIGFYRTASQSDDYRANVYRACPMHTSTGRDYIIINGGVAAYNPEANPTLTEVYALPIMPGTSAYAGQLAQTNGANAFTLLNAVSGSLLTVDRTHVSPNFYTGSNTIFTSDERSAVVGADPRYLDPNQTGVPIQDMYIVGDTVIIALAGDRSSCTQEAGIFQSTALFDQDGLICGFTPWQRVGQPQTDTAFAVGYDATTGNYIYLTTNDVFEEC